MEKTLGTSEIPRLRAPQSGVRYRYSTKSNQRIPSKAESVVTGSIALKSHRHPIEDTTKLCLFG